jgi:hypothetical protein
MKIKKYADRRQTDGKFFFVKNHFFIYFFFFLFFFYGFSVHEINTFITIVNTYKVKTEVKTLPQNLFELKFDLFLVFRSMQVKYTFMYFQFQSGINWQWIAGLFWGWCGVYLVCQISLVTYFKWCLSSMVYVVYWGF